MFPSTKEKIYTFILYESGFTIYKNVSNLKLKRVRIDVKQSNPGKKEMSRSIS